MTITLGLLLFFTYGFAIFAIASAGFLTTSFFRETKKPQAFFWLPLFCVVVGLAAGITFAHCFSGFFCALVFGVLLFFTFFSWWHKSSLERVFAFCFLFTFFSGVGFWGYRLHKAYHETVVKELLERSFFRGRIDSVLDRGCKNNRYKFRVCITDSLHRADFASHYVDLFLSKERFVVGDLVSFSGFELVFSRPDFFKDNVLGLVFPSSGLRVWRRGVSEASYGFFQRLWQCKQNVKKLLLNGLSEQSQSFITTIFLGFRDASFFDLIPPFRNWGLSHYLARSGLHIVIFITLWMFLMFVVPLGLRLRQLLLLCLTGFYYVMTWTNVSFWRAFVMFFLFSFGRFFLRPASHLYSLLLAAFFLLLLSPFQLFAMGFQLSFGLVFALFFASEGLGLWRDFA